MINHLTTYSEENYFHEYNEEFAQCIIALEKLTFVYEANSNHTKYWYAIERRHKEIANYLAISGKALVLDRQAGFAYIIQQKDDEGKFIPSMGKFHSTGRSEYTKGRDIRAFLITALNVLYTKNKDYSSFEALFDLKDLKDEVEYTMQSMNIEKEITEDDIYKELKEGIFSKLIQKINDDDMIPEHFDVQNTYKILPMFTSVFSKDIIKQLTDISNEETNKIMNDAG